jgi:aminopeptidase N
MVRRRGGRRQPVFHYRAEVTRSRPLALTVGAALLGVLASAVPVLAGGTAEAAGADATPAGAAGIGDPYFPLDGNGGIDVLSYDVHDRYRFGSGRLTGWTTLRVRTTAAVSSFDLDFLLAVRSVTVDGAAVPFDQSVRHELVVHRAATAGELLRVVVRYAGRPGAAVYDGERNWLADAHEVVAMNEPHMAPWWFPADDHPLDKAPITVSITAPRADRVVAGGRLVARRVHGRLATTTWRSAQPMAPYLAFFAAGRFQVAQGRSRGLPWYAAVSGRLGAADRRSAMDLLRRSPAIVRWLQRQLRTPYPFGTTGGLVTSLAPGFALETQTRPTYPAGMADAVTTEVHELAHQWFGDSVSVAAWSDTWLNEGAATFMEARWAETHGGPPARAWLRRWYDDLPADSDFWSHRVDDPCPAHAGCVGSIFAWWVYQRGAMTLEALRRVVGETDFWEILRRWVTDHAGGNGSTAELEALAGEVSGRDLRGFFDAWLHQPSKPADTAALGLR